MMMNMMTAMINMMVMVMALMWILMTMMMMIIIILVDSHIVDVAAGVDADADVRDVEWR